MRMLDIYTELISRLYRKKGLKLQKRYGKSIRTIEREI